MGNIVHTLTNRRYGEKCIAYAESHDQVGPSATPISQPHRRGANVINESFGMEIGVTAG